MSHSIGSVGELEVDVLLCCDIFADSAADERCITALVKNLETSSYFIRKGAAIQISELN